MPTGTAMPGSGSPMTHDADTLKHIIRYCDKRWTEADAAPEGPFQSPDTQIGKKMAYNDVLQYARKLIGEREN
jgi:hypothetical protein